MNATVAQLVEYDLAKVGVAGSSPVFRSEFFELLAGNSDCENSSVGRARPCQGRGRGFESRFSLTCPDGGIGRRATLRG